EWRTSRCPFVVGTPYSGHVANRVQAERRQSLTLATPAKKLATSYRIRNHWRLDGASFISYSRTGSERCGTPVPGTQGGDRSAVARVSSSTRASLSNRLV